MDESKNPTALENHTDAPPAPPPHRTAPPAPPPVKPRRSRAGWIWLLLLGAIAVAAYLYWPNFTASKTGTASSGKGGRGGRGGMPPPPVVVVKATRGNIGVYYTGIGLVTPIYTVTVRSRVDGELMTVYYKEGDMIQKDAPLVEIDPRPYQAQLTQAEGNLVRDQALLENARIDLARYQTLLKQNAIPEQQLATQQALVKQYEGTVATDQGAIDTAKLNVVYAHIIAPITGRVGLRLVDPGNIVHATDTNGLLVITQVQPISVVFTIAEDQLPAVMQKYHAGQKLSVDAFDRDLKTLLAHGVLTTIDNQIDPTTGTLRLRANFNNENNRLFANEFVNARLLVEEKRGIVLLPTAAVQRNSQMTYVYLVRPDSTVTVRQISVGTTEGFQSEVTSGLNPGDTVVMTGVDKLTEGAKVRISTGGAGRPGASGQGAQAGADTTGGPGASVGGADQNSPTNGSPGQHGHRGNRGGNQNGNTKQQ